MTDDIYQQQRREGAALIAKKARELARAQGFVIEHIEWDQGQPIQDRTKHLLAVTVGGKTLTGEFPDEWLADYPGRVGTEKADAMLASMIRGFR